MAWDVDSVRRGLGARSHDEANAAVQAARARRRQHARVASKLGPDDEQALERLIPRGFAEMAHERRKARLEQEALARREARRADDLVLSARTLHLEQAIHELGALASAQPSDAGIPSEILGTPTATLWAIAASAVRFRRQAEPEGRYGDRGYPLTSVLEWLASQVDDPHWRHERLPEAQRFLYEGRVLVQHELKRIQRLLHSFNPYAPLADWINRESIEQRLEQLQLATSPDPAKVSFRDVFASAVPQLARPLLRAEQARLGTGGDSIPAEVSRFAEAAQRAMPGTDIPIVRDTSGRHDVTLGLPRSVTQISGLAGSLEKVQRDCPDDAWPDVQPFVGLLSSLDVLGRLSTKVDDTLSRLDRLDL
jgi:hypothetical protein